MQDMWQRPPTLVDWMQGFLYRGDLHPGSREGAEEGGGRGPKGNAPWEEDLVVQGHP